MSQVTQPTKSAEAPAGPAHRAEKVPLSEGARAERRLGWTPCAPAVIVMNALTPYSIGYAIHLYLHVMTYGFRLKQSSSGSRITEPSWPRPCRRPPPG